MSFHVDLVKGSWAERLGVLREGHQVVLDGHSLSLGTLVAVAR